jgi:hypothetical protein
MGEAVVFNETVDCGDDVAMSGDVVQGIRSIFLYPNMMLVVRPLYRLQHVPTKAGCPLLRLEGRLLFSCL